MRCRLMAVLALGAVCSAPAAFNERPAGGRSAALAGASCLPGDLWWGVTSPASLSGLRVLELGASFSPAPFGMTELTRSAAAIALPALGDGAVFYASRFGYELYREHEIGGGICLALGASASLGLALRTYLISIERYGSAVSLGVCASASVSLSEEVECSVVADNLNRPMIGSSGERVGLTLLAGITFTPLPSIFIAGLISGESNTTPEGRLGIEFQPVPFLALRGGLATEPAQISAGIGLRLGGVRFDYAARHHTALGVTHTVSLECAPGEF